MELYLILTITLLMLGVVGSLLPMLPGALLSITGILVYWWSNGFTRPGTLFVTGFVAVGMIAVLTDYFGGSIAAKAGGASNKTSILAGLAGFVMFFVMGPAGILAGVAGTVFLREYLRTGDAEKGSKAAFYSTIGVLGSTVVQFVVTLSLLTVFLLALVL